MGHNPSENRVWTETLFVMIALRANRITSLIAPLIKIKVLLSRRRLLHVITHPLDHVSGAIGVVHNAAECLPDLAQVRWLHVQKILCRTGVVAGAGDRLRDFVRQRGGQFSHHAHAIHVGEIRLQSAQPLLGAFALR